MVPYEPKAGMVTPEDLPAEFHPLMEQIAEQVHDAWAAGRLAEGWRYGPVLDREAKTHPDLVPYGQLPESERAYDRRTAAQTIDGLLRLGYRIVKAE